jgi:hypothetical protein
VLRCLMCALVVMSITVPSRVAAQKNCTRGIPCGNTCIAANRTCRVGTTRSAVPRAPSSPPVAARVSEGRAQYVASRRGKVYYRKGCRAAAALAPQNVITFASASAAAAAGYRPSTQAGCGPVQELPGGTEEQPAASARVFLSSRNGGFFYRAGCPVAAELADTVWFPSAEAATQSGRRASAVPGC